MDHSAGQSSNVTAGLAGRYATALFELGVESGTLPAIEESLTRVEGAIANSPELAAALRSPRIARKDGEALMATLARELALDDTVAKFLGVLAQNRRLAELPAMIRAARALGQRHRGEVRAEVTTAHPLADDQLDALRQQLRARVGREVMVDTKVDPSLLGGLVVRLGSQRIDASIRTRLNSFAQAMKG